MNRIIHVDRESINNDDRRNCRNSRISQIVWGVDIVGTFTTQLRLEYQKLWQDFNFWYSFLPKIELFLENKMILSMWIENVNLLYECTLYRRVSHQPSFSLCTVYMYTIFVCRWPVYVHTQRKLFINYLCKILKMYFLRRTAEQM